MILSACIPEPENPTIQLSETSQLAQVRDWFEANKTNLRLPDRGTNYRTESQELILPFFEKEPDWEQFHHYYFPDGREVFEVSLENENLYIPKAKDAGASEEDVDYFQNILFVKHPTLPKFDPLIIRYYPDENTSNRDFEAISYQMIDEKWSGWIDLFTYDEHYLMGYKVTEGELTHTREMQKNPENARKIAVSSENKSDEAIHCYPVATDWYDGRTGEYLDTTWAQTCEWQRGGSRSGGGRGDGGYDEEKPRGGADSPGGGCKKCYDPPEVPEPKTIIINKLTNPCASNIFLQIKKGTWMNSIKNQKGLASALLSLFENAANFDFIFTNGPRPSGVNSNATTSFRRLNLETGNWEIEITLYDEYLQNATELSIARSIIHESLHAYLQYVEFENINELGIYTFENYLSEFSINHGYPNNSRNVIDHNFMSNYLDGIARSLQEWDMIYGIGYGVDFDYYSSLAWGGLTDVEKSQGVFTESEVFKSMVPNETDRQKIKKIINNENSGEPNAKGKKCS